MAVGISLYDKQEIDTSSQEFREKISIAIKEYILEHWDECVEEKKSYRESTKNFTVQLEIEL